VAEVVEVDAGAEQAAHQDRAEHGLAAVGGEEPQQEGQREARAQRGDEVDRERREQVHRPAARRRGEQDREQDRVGGPENRRAAPGELGLEADLHADVVRGGGEDGEQERTARPRHIGQAGATPHAVEQ
jgi:hypothetical protein